MIELALAGLLALLCLALLQRSGRLGFVATELATTPQRLAGLGLLWAILLACVFYPTVVPGDAAAIDPATVWFPALFTAHALLLAFLFAWWRLAGKPDLRRFLQWNEASLGVVRLGVAVGVVGWLLAIFANLIATTAFLILGWLATLIGLGSGEVVPLTTEVPALLIWLAELPLLQRLIVVAVAMTVEEAFYRGYLQPRIGWIPSSVLFALSHAGYGLPALMVSVFVISLAIGWALRETRSLVPCIVAHGVFDAIQLLVVMPWAVELLRDGA
ncbi:MAG: lysostaphin resistance A-like protein [Candidatus Binatia bacterium]